MLSVSFVQPHSGTVDSKTRGDLPYKMIVLLTPYWRMNCEVVPLTMLKCNILNYSSNCYTKITKKIIT